MSQVILMMILGSIYTMCIFIITNNGNRLRRNQTTKSAIEKKTTRRSQEKETDLDIYV